MASLAYAMVRSSHRLKRIPKEEPGLSLPFTVASGYLSLMRAIEKGLEPLMLHVHEGKHGSKVSKGLC